MASLIAILDLKGKPLIQRSYRDDVPATQIERFLPLILEFEEEGQQVTPCFTNQGINFMHIRHSNLYRTRYSSQSTLHPQFLVHSSPCPFKKKLECRRNYLVSPPTDLGTLFLCPDSSIAHMVI